MDIQLIYKNNKDGGMVKYAVSVYREDDENNKFKEGVFNIDIDTDEFETKNVEDLTVSDNIKRLLISRMEYLKEFLTIRFQNAQIKGGSFDCVVVDDDGNKEKFSIYFTLILENQTREINLKMETDYYDLVEIKHLYTHQVFHIPASFFPKEFLDTLPYSCILRDEHFFHCPVCGEPSFFSGICNLCSHDNHSLIKRKVEEYNRYEQQKKRFKDRFLKMVKSGKQISQRFKVSYVRSE